MTPHSPPARALSRFVVGAVLRAGLGLGLSLVLSGLQVVAGEPGHDCGPLRRLVADAPRVVVHAGDPLPPFSAFVVDDSEAADLSAPLAWTLEVVTLQEAPLCSLSGVTVPVKPGSRIGGTLAGPGRLEGLALAPGRYAYRFTALGYEGGGGFLDVLAPGEEAAAPHPDAAPRRTASLLPGLPWNFYYGAPHAHTAYSDGGIPVTACSGAVAGPHAGATPAEAFAYAADPGALDWVAVLEHNHLIDDACGATCTDAQVRTRFHEGLAAAQAATTSSFLGIYGMEWGVTSTGGHAALYGNDKLFGWESAAEVNTPEGDYLGLWAAASDPANQGPEGAAASLCHPVSGDFNNYTLTPAGKSLVAGIAVISGPYNESRTDFPDGGTRYAGPLASTDRYKYVLKRDWRVGPEAHPDNHCWNYGTSTRNRTVLLSKSLTRAEALSAMKSRRFYATSDRNVQVFFGTPDYGRAMGETFSHLGNSLDLFLWIDDPDGDTVATVDLYKGNPASSTTTPTSLAMTPAGAGVYTASVPVPATGEFFYYVYATLASGAEIWTAPVWVSACSGGTAPSAVGSVFGEKLGSAAEFTWTAPAGYAVHHYLVYASIDAAAPFPSGWTRIATVFEPAEADALASGWRFYQVLPVDACGSEGGR